MSQARLRAPSGDRMILADHVPLDKPLCIRIEPTQVCNFRCEFCPVSLKCFREHNNHGFMSFDLFQKVIMDIKKSFGSVKNIMLVGMGESLLHSHITDMIQMIVRENVSESVEITTNGSLLTHDMSQALCESNLSLLRISVNGLSAADYKKHCGISLDFDEYVSNIQHLYSVRKNTKIYVKIINYMVQTDEQYQRFLDIFSPICDMISVENLIEGDSRIDYHKIAGNNISFEQTQSNTDLLETKICTMPYYTLQINCDGSVYPCCTPGVRQMGNVNESSVGEIWEKEALAFQKLMLDGVEGIPFCNQCASMQYRVYPEDALDSAADRLKLKYRI